MNSKTTLLLTSLISLAACNTTGASNETALKLSELTGADLSDQDLAGYTKAYFASGCFWCVEEVFESVRGVAEVVSGYAGGKEQNPTYEQVGRGATGHAEAVEVYYDPKVVSFQTLVDVFFASQDPTTPNRQGPDAGTQYRSIAFFTTPEEKAQIEATIIKLNASGTFDDPIVTEITPFEKFWPAEDYHQNYVRLHPNEGYVQGVSIPRFDRFKQQLPEVLK
ncbi:MAG: peptide-methionine (S)-S-oxide reductase MsrA [Flavobacteriales bacterium]|nr:peptide-methionine (S)-S-oxide reductase MsrA [Flavobacteriales bacterium]MBK6946410.1 peptide-methionine (S)-S-oxide reductase MsrA [Flavobacteriales bacterium]MBK7238633.1 peptide-methionine (S)-S-oxide reductase MsrA [Flavobacteriales bacterium]MBK7297996.1 peptide-methionine (S)-S-oxide reductase MsrA [Flavobacteriales bacterium]MBK9536458.1 peptide-methionine (S)-S-oxide reductase MsrA [Flavobacteriales bacterium]